MFESTTPEDARLKLRERVYVDFENFVVDGKTPGFLARRTLRSHGLWEETGLSAVGEQYAHAMTHRRSRLIVRQLTATSIVATVMWVSPESITCVRHSDGHCLMWRIDACELPALVAKLVGFEPRVTYDCGPRRVESEIVEATISFNLGLVESLLVRAAQAYEEAPEEGIAETPLSYGLKNRLWTLSMLTCEVDAPDTQLFENGDSTVSVMYLAVPESMFRLSPSDDSTSSLEITMTRPLAEWEQLTALTKVLP